MTRARRFAAGAFAALFLALHLPFLPASLEDLDSINFALGVRDFDVTRHQPHPPGYPIYILVAKAAHRIVSSEAAALSAVGIVSAALAAFAFQALFRRVPATSTRNGTAIVATGLAMAAPLFWFTAARPLSDVPGLAAAIGVQVATLAAWSSPGIAFAAFLAGLATGIRSQIAWLTVPLIALTLSRSRGSSRGVVAVRVLVAFVAGGLVWGIPLVWLTGGPAAYSRVLFNQGAEDLTGVAMVWTTPTIRQFAVAAYSTVVAPWSSIPLAVVVIGFAATGAVALWQRARASLMTLLVAFGPYLLFDLLFQESVTTRYALPVVVPIAYLAASGLDLLPARFGALAAVVLASWMAVPAEQALIRYSHTEAPAFRMLADMSMAAQANRSTPAVMAMHRREDFDLRRPIVWVGDRMPAVRAMLPAPPKHEWMELVKYWNGGGGAPIWLVADPLRSDLALIDHAEPERAYRWTFDAADMIGGIRPGEMDWYVIDRPLWYLGEGWAVTPETAGVAREDRRGPSRGPVSGWIWRHDGPTTFMIGGRNLVDGGPAATLHISIDGRKVDDLSISPGFFLNMLTLPAGSLAGQGAYASMTVAADGLAATSQSDIALEQFDAKPMGRVVFGYGEGWLEQEYNPRTGKHWRWTTDHATIRIRSDRRPLLLTLAGETETFRKLSHVVVRAGDQVLDEEDVGDRFTVSVGIPAGLLDTGETSITIQTDQTYVPAERPFRRSRDRRRLGLKIYDCRVTVPS